MSKFYSVKYGRKIGIFNTWDECKAQVDGFKGALYKSFPTLALAQAYLGEVKKEALPLTNDPVLEEMISTMKQQHPQFFEGPTMTPQDYQELVKEEEREEKEREEKEREGKEREMKNIRIYTDGSHTGNRAGWAFVVVCGSKIMEVSYGKVEGVKQTNNMGELTAIMKALYWILNNKEKEDKTYYIYSDSKYSVSALTEWYKNWQKNGWKTSSGSSVDNSELIRKCLSLIQMALPSTLNLEHVFAHEADSNPIHQKYNTLVDNLAKQGRDL